MSNSKPLLSLVKYLTKFLSSSCLINTQFPLQKLLDQLCLSIKSLRSPIFKSPLFRILIGLYFIISALETHLN